MLWKVVLEAYHGGISVSSNTARTRSDYVAMAASLGYISTGTGTGFGRVWRVTQKGMAACMEGK